MKKFALYCLAAACAASVVSCGDSDDDGQKDTPTQNNSCSADAAPICDGDGMHVISCVDGSWSVSDNCTVGCSDGKCIDGTAIVCEHVGETRCTTTGKNVLVCGKDNRWDIGPTCTRGCTDGQCNAGPQYTLGAECDPDTYELLCDEELLVGCSLKSHTVVTNKCSAASGMACREFDSGADCVTVLEEGDCLDSSGQPFEGMLYFSPTQSCDPDYGDLAYMRCERDKTGEMFLVTDYSYSVCDPQNGYTMCDNEGKLISVSNEKCGTCSYDEETSTASCSDVDVTHLVDSCNDEGTDCFFARHKFQQIDTSLYRECTAEQKQECSDVHGGDVGCVLMNYGYEDAAVCTSKCNEPGPVDANCQDSTYSEYSCVQVGDDLVVVQSLMAICVDNSLYDCNDEMLSFRDGSEKTGGEYCLSHEQYGAGYYAICNDSSVYCLPTCDTVNEEHVICEKSGSTGLSYTYDEVCVDFGKAKAWLPLESTVCNDACNSDHTGCAE